MIAVSSAHAGEQSTALHHPPPRLQLHDTLLSGRALDRVDQPVARHSESEVHLESRAHSEGVCRAPVGLGNGVSSMAFSPLSQDFCGVSREEVGIPKKTTLLTGCTWCGMLSHASLIKA
jgi:hypothetical protein